MTVLPVNDPPVAQPDTALVIQEDTISLNLLANDTDVENSPLTLIGVDELSEGTLRFTEDGAVTITASAEFEGTVTLEYVIQDEDGAQAAGALVYIAERRLRPRVALSKTSTSTEVNPGASLV